MGIPWTVFFSKVYSIQFVVGSGIGGQDVDALLGVAKCLGKLGCD
jgi:hypothetical protein